MHALTPILAVSFCFLEFINNPKVGAMLAQFVNGALVAHPARLLLTAAFTLVLGSLTPALLPADQTGRPVQDFAAPASSSSYSNGTTTAYNDEDDGASLGTAASASSNNNMSGAEQPGSIASFGHKGRYQRITDDHRQR